MIEGQPSRTAEGVAFQRALERLAPPAYRILDDPFAVQFLSRTSRRIYDRAAAFGPNAIKFPGFFPALTTYVCSRHAYIDDALLTAVRGGVRQVVVLGAGYDSRSMRFGEALNGAQMWELDFPATQARKVRRLQRLDLPDLPGLARIAVDFRHDPWRRALEQSAFDPDKPTFWIWEGVAMYLPSAAVDATMRDIRELSATGSFVVLETWGAESRNMLTRWYDLASWFLCAMGEPVVFRLLPSEVAAWAAHRGFEAVDVCSGELLERRLARGRRMYQGCAVSLLRVGESAGL